MNDCDGIFDDEVDEKPASLVQELPIKAFTTYNPCIYIDEFFIYLIIKNTITIIHSIIIHQH